MILEDNTKADLEKLVSKIMTLAIQNGFYEFVPGYFLCDNQYLIEYQKQLPDNLLVKDKDFTSAPFWILQIEKLKPCNDSLKIAEIILMTEGLGNEAESHDGIN